MAIVFSFLPFIVFAVLTRITSVSAALCVAAAVAIALTARDLSRGRSLKVLEIGTIVLFAGLAALVMATRGAWSIVGVRLAVDSGLLAIVLLSIAIRRPFTLQYAREQVPPEVARMPLFIRTNTIITAVWALAFAVMVAADLVMLYATDVPMSVGVVATVAALYGAVRFTITYPERVRARAAVRTAPSE